MPGQLPLRCINNCVCTPLVPRNGGGGLIYSLMATPTIRSSWVVGMIATTTGVVKSNPGLPWMCGPISLGGITAGHLVNRLVGHQWVRYGGPHTTKQEEWVDNNKNNTIWDDMAIPFYQITSRVLIKLIDVHIIEHSSQFIFRKGIYAWCKCLRTII